MNFVSLIDLDPFHLYGLLTSLASAVLNRDPLVHSMGIELFDFFQSGISYSCVVKLLVRHLVLEHEVVVHVIDFIISEANSERLHVVDSEVVHFSAR